jgi:hypothetical protein
MPNVTEKRLCIAYAQEEECGVDVSPAIRYTWTRDKTKLLSASYLFSVPPKEAAKTFIHYARLCPFMFPDSLYFVITEL